MYTMISIDRERGYQSAVEPEHSKGSAESGGTGGIR